MEGSPGAAPPPCWRGWSHQAERGVVCLTPFSEDTSAVRGLREGGHCALQLSGSLGPAAHCTSNPLPCRRTPQGTTGDGQTLEGLPPAWEASVEFRAPGLHRPKPGYGRHLGSEPAGGRSASAFQIKKELKQTLEI